MSDLPSGRAVRCGVWSVLKVDDKMWCLICPQRERLDVMSDLSSKRAIRCDVWSVLRTVYKMSDLSSKRAIRCDVWSVLTAVYVWSVLKAGSTMSDLSSWQAIKCDIWSVLMPGDKMKLVVNKPTFNTLYSTHQLSWRNVCHSKDKVLCQNQNCFRLIQWKWNIFR